MKRGERQIATRLQDVRADHIARYQWASAQIKQGIVLDIGAGIGYGSKILAGRKVLSLEIDQGAIAHGQKHFGAWYKRRNLDGIGCFYGVPYAEAAIAFEVIEHLTRPRQMLERIPADVLFASVPNQNIWQYDKNMTFHHRHYTEHGFADLLESAGWRVVNLDGQFGMHSKVGGYGRTIVVRAERIKPPKRSIAPREIIKA